MQRLNNAELLESAIQEIKNSVDAIETIANIMRSYSHGGPLPLPICGIATILDMATRYLEDIEETIDGVRLELDKESGE